MSYIKKIKADYAFNKRTKALASAAFKKQKDITAQKNRELSRKKAIAQAKERARTGSYGFGSTLKKGLDFSSKGFNLLADLGENVSRNTASKKSF